MLSYEKASTHRQAAVSVDAIQLFENEGFFGLFLLNIAILKRELNGIICKILFLKYNKEHLQASGK